MVMKPRLLDLFCKAGGTTKGYQRAGFYVVGVDIEPQPHYCGDEFYQADALEFLESHWQEFDAFSASPPCQAYSVMTLGRWKHRKHPDLIGNVRKLFAKTGRPYVIENVEGARKNLINPILLCGTMFGLQTRAGNQLRRHRYFECFPFFSLVPTCQHNKASAIGVYGGGQNPARKRPATIGVWGHSGGSSSRDGISGFSVDDRRDAMGIDWMTGEELSQAIPPAYTEWIGNQLMMVLNGI